jgi:HAD superfamily hydrolase (TIGR01509 family)
MLPRALLFDFDGVIADTENVHIVAWERTFGDMGLTVPEEVCARAVELDDRDFLISVFADRGYEDADVDGWIERKQRLTVMLLGDSPRLYPGVVELVRQLEGKTRLAVVSTTWRENITTVLTSAGIADAFATIVGKEDVPATKPAPDAYRKALRRLKVRKAEAVTFEDSFSGHVAAWGAGVPCVIVGHRRGKEGWVGDLPYLPDFSDPDRVLATLGRAASR